MRKIKSGEESGGSAFTSMIDIVFLLLIFFILQPFKENDFLLQADLPQREEREGPKPPQVSVQVRILPAIADPTAAQYVIDGHAAGSSYKLGTTQLAGWLMKQSNNDATAPVAIIPDGNVQFAHVLRVLDACYQVKMSKVSFAATN